MNDSFGDLIKTFARMMREFQEKVQLTEKDLLVIGCSTSEVVGAEIGTAGSEIAANIIYEQLAKFQEKTGVALAFQSCEHINRALVIEREVAERLNYEIVSVIPVRSAGGAMAAYAYTRFNDPVMVEKVTGDAGIDIGDTFIGMHLKRVAVPVRTSNDTLGNAHVTYATTRPRLIGGERAVYRQE